MTHFQQSVSFLTPSSRPLEFSSRIRQVMAKFRSFKVGKQRPLNGSFNFMVGTHVRRIRGQGQHFPRVGVQKSGPCNVSIFTYDLWSCLLRNVTRGISHVYVLCSIHTRSHGFMKNRIPACSGDYREQASIFLTCIESASCRCVHYFWNEPRITD